MKLCKDCKYSAGDPNYLQCVAPENTELDMVTGGRRVKHLQFCDNIRYNHAEYVCGVDAIWFVQKPPEDVEVIDPSVWVNSYFSLVKSNMIQGIVYGLAAGLAAGLLIIAAMIAIKRYFP